MRIFLKLPRVRLPGDNTGQLVPSSVRHGHQNNIREWDKNRKLLNKKIKKTRLTLLVLILRAKNQFHPSDFKNFNVVPISFLNFILVPTFLKKLSVILIFLKQFNVVILTFLKQFNVVTIHVIQCEVAQSLR